MKFNLRILIYIILPGVLMFLAWPPQDLFFLSFLGFVPLLLLEKELRGKKLFFLYAYISILIFNILTTWWVWYASAPGSVVMLLANSLLMTTVLWVYKKSVEPIGQNRALMLLASLWVAFEYLHLSWEITWPWLTLGNVFSKHNFIIQWYEYTGTLGGSLWILLINFMVFKIIDSRTKGRIIALISIVVLPVVLSLIILRKARLEEQQLVAKNEAIETIIVQPNLDPYTDKFKEGEEVNAIRNILTDLEDKITSKTQLVILPETAIVEYVDEDNPNRFESINLIERFLIRHPSIHFITGLSSYNFYDVNEKRSPTARIMTTGDAYESYNAAIEMDTSGIKKYHHKSKLVPGVEKMPYPQVFGILEKLSLDMGGVSGSLGSDDSVNLFKVGELPDLAPLICYESVFPEYASRFVAKGAEIILVITNDGWWKNTDGHKQHMYYASLRAIENRREVLRSANTGISCHISSTGKINIKTKWWERDFVKVEAHGNTRITFFTKHGNIIGKLAGFIGVFLALGVFVKKRIKHSA